MSLLHRAGQAAPDPIPSPYVGGVEILYAPDKASLKTADDAALWLQMAAANIGTNPNAGLASEYEWIRTPADETGASGAEFNTTVLDDLGNQYTITGQKNVNINGLKGEGYFNTSIAFTTDLGLPTEHTEAVYRDESYTLARGLISDKKAMYTVGKYVDNTLDGAHDPQLTRSKPGELSTKEEAEAERKYIELSNNFRFALESKMARVFPVAIHNINRAYVESKQKKAQDFMQKPSLSGRLFGRS